MLAVAHGACTRVQLRTWEFIREHGIHSYNMAANPHVCLPFHPSLQLAQVDGSLDELTPKVRLHQYREALEAMGEEMLKMVDRDAAASGDVAATEKKTEPATPANTPRDGGEEEMSAQEIAELNAWLGGNAGAAEGEDETAPLAADSGAAAPAADDSWGAAAAATEGGGDDSWGAAAAAAEGGGEGTWAADGTAGGYGEQSGYAEGGEGYYDTTAGYDATGHDANAGYSYQDGTYDASGGYDASAYAEGDGSAAAAGEAEKHE